MRRHILSCITVMACLAVFAATAQAVPTLQIYSPDPDVFYDDATETWIIPHLEYELWVIGANEEIFDVKMALAVPTDEDGTITVVHGSTTTVLNEDLSYQGEYAGPHAPFFIADGTPLMGDGDPLPPHGVFPTSYYQYYIGNFGLDQTVQNYIPGGDGGTALGHIESFTIAVNGYSWVDIVAYDHVVKGKNKAKYVKSPFSHDGGSGAPVPEPATMLLLATGLTGLAAVRRRLTS